MWKSQFILRRTVVYLSQKVTLTHVVALAYLYLCYLAVATFHVDCMVRSPEAFLSSVRATTDVAGKCSMDGRQLGWVSVSSTLTPSIDDIARASPEVGPGGTWRPSDCEAWQKVAIVIPYRDRWKHLLKLLRRLHPMLQKQKIHYQIFVIEQAGNAIFNRGKIKNIGYLEAMKVNKFDCVILHDVDLLPEHDRNYYMCNNDLRHLSVAIDEMGYQLWYYSIAGGVIALSTSNFALVNGFSNLYWGWGVEDDDLSARVQYSKIAITRPPVQVGRYKMVRHTKDTDAGASRMRNWHVRWPKDGLRDPDGMRYTVVSSTLTPLYTNITVDVGLPPADLQTKFDEGPFIGFFWRFKFYLRCDIIDPEDPKSFKQC